MNIQTLNSDAVSSHNAYHLAVGVCWPGRVEPSQSWKKVWSSEDTISPNFIQGDIAVPVSHTGADEDALYAFVTDQKALWMTGVVPYWIEEDEYDGDWEQLYN